MRFDRCESSEEWLLQMSHLAQSWKRQPISAYWNELQTKAEITRSCSFWLLFRRETVSHGGINSSLTLHTTWKMRAHHFVSFDAIYSTLNKITSQKESQPVQQWCCWIKPSMASKARMLTFPSKRESKHAAVGTLRVISSSEKPMTVLWIILTTTCCAFYLLSPTQRKLDATRQQKFRISFSTLFPRPSSDQLPSDTTSLQRGKKKFLGYDRSCKKEWYHEAYTYFFPHIICWGWGLCWSMPAGPAGDSFPRRGRQRLSRPLTPLPYQKTSRVNFVFGSRSEGVLQPCVEQCISALLLIGGADVWPQSCFSPVGETPTHTTASIQFWIKLCTGCPNRTRGMKPQPHLLLIWRSRMAARPSGPTVRNPY